VGRRHTGARRLTHSRRPPAKGAGPDPTLEDEQRESREPGQSELTDRERQMADERARPSVHVVHEAIRKEGEEQLERPSRALAWSGLAAGMSMGFSLMAQGLIRGDLPDASWAPLLWKLGYPLGFVIIVMGRQELFTETTLTAVVPLLGKRNLDTLTDTARVWSVVLVANLAGAAIFALVVAHLGVFSPDVREQFRLIGSEAARGAWGTIVIRGVFAGWLIALVVWLMPLSGAGRLGVIVILTYFVGLGDLSHSVAGSVEVMYAAAVGTVSWSHYLGGYLVPTLIGNIIGGASLVAALNTAQVMAGKRNPGDEGMW
jgi:formate/nitrite transporter FocA (FNT family)